MFVRKEKVKGYDRDNLKPVIRVSICTGEQVAGFRNIHTGKFSEDMLIRDSRDLAEFRKLYGLSEEELEREY